MDALRHQYKIGQLREVIQIQGRRTRTQTESGSLEYIFADVRKCWAKKEDISSIENYKVDELTAVTKVVFIIRHFKNLNKKMIIKHDNRIYEIDGIIETPTLRFQKIICNLKE